MAIHPGLNSRYTVDQKKGEKTMAYLKGYVDHIRFGMKITDILY